MINAWSLLYDEMNGTMDKTYPIKNTEGDEDIKITTGIGNTIFNVPEDVEIDEDIPEVVTVGGADEGVLNIDGGDTLNFDDYPSAFTAFADNDDSIAHHIGLNTANYDTLNIDLSGINSYSVDSSTLNIGTPLPGGMGEDHIYLGDTKPEPNLDYKSHKYEEDKGIKDLKDYVSSTYNGHYTSKQNNTQTLDLIQSVGDAESFCRSNAIKYLARYDKKGSAKQDILKAMHYCLLLYYFSGNTKEPDYTNTRYETF